MTALSNRTYPAPHIIYESDYIGREIHVAEGVDEGNVVKDFNIDRTRIKICDDYCYDKTPEAVQAILDRIALRAQEQLTIQQTLSQGR